jgi:hypothetical protein
MSKFDEMCYAYEEAKKKWAEYHARSQKQISTLSTGFVKYCEIPQGSFSFVPAEGGKVDQHYTPLDAIKYEEDGYWHFGWRMKLPHSIMTAILLKEIEPDVVSVRCGWEKQDRLIDLRDEKQCQEFYDVVVQRIKDFYKRTQDIGKADRPGKLGFQLS